MPLAYSCVIFYVHSGHLPQSSELLTKEDIVKVKRCLYALQRDGLPPVTTHNVVCIYTDIAKIIDNLTNNMIVYFRLG